jgi:hypothetical protein
MDFINKSPLTQILDGLFFTYKERVPYVSKITRAMIKQNLVSSQSQILNDRIAFRTLGVNHLGVKSFEKIFLHYGYKKRDFFRFDKKKLKASWYSPPEYNLPRIFISELCVDELSKKSQEIINSYVNVVKMDPVNDINLNDVSEVVSFFRSPLWKLPSLKDYKFLLNESEYASWVIYNRYYLNHYTISVHELPEGYRTLEKFNKFLMNLGVKLNDSGGLIKISKDGLLKQSSTIANKVLAKFKNNEKSYIAGSYVEFAERKVLPEYSHLKEIKDFHRRDGFETGNADLIFESTFSDQVNKI